MIIEKVYDKPSSLLIDGIPIVNIKPNTQLNRLLGIPKGIILHWTAGSQRSAYNDYHYCITELNNKPVVLQTLKLTQCGQHLWGRNSNMIGISLCCMDNPKNKPTPKMIDACSILLSELSAWKKIGLDDRLTVQKKQRSGELLINKPGTILIDAITDHANYAKIDNYYPERWDIAEYLDIIKNKAKVYFKELKSGKREFIFKEIL